MSGPGKNEQEEQVEHLRELITALHPGAVTTTEPIPATSQQPSSSSSSSTAPAQLAPLSQQPRQTAPPKPGDKEHIFWDTQPVAKMSQVVAETEVGAIETAENKVVRPTPYDLPPGFEWCDVDIDNAAEADALFNLLSMNYVEDNDHMFRFGYPIPFLQWALKPPGWRSEWLIGVRATQSKRLLAFISAVPARIRVNRDTMPMVEINFLCVHKKLRSQKLAPVLILEVTRRVNLTGVYQAVYTAGVELPKPVAKCRYWHRSLNPKKLIEVGFSGLKRGYTMAKTIKEYELPKAPTMAGLRPLEPRDVPQARALVSSELAEAKLTAVFDSDDEFAHWFLPRDGIIYSYVLEREGKLTDFLSFYNLPSTILRHPEHKVLNAAYAYYFANTTVTKEILTYNALILAKETGHDVFNALNLGPNAIKNFDAHKFGIGDGSLHYYLFNWLTPEMNPEDVRLVLM